MLLKSNEMLGEEKTWVWVNDWQKVFLENFFSKKAELAEFSQKELKTWASSNVEELNETAKNQGLDIALNDFSPEGFGAISVMDILFQWTNGKAETILTYSGQEYPALKIYSRFCIKTSSAYPYPVIALRSKTVGDTIYMTIAPEKQVSFYLIDKIEKIRQNLYRTTSCDYLKFPMIDMNHIESLDWLLGLWTPDKGSSRWEIAQAWQQTKIKISAGTEDIITSGMFALRIGEEKGITIRDPFFLWIERQGVSFPLVYAYIDQSDWKS